MEAFGVRFEEEMPRWEPLRYNEATQTHDIPLEEMRPTNPAASTPYETSTGTFRDLDG